MAAWLLGVTPRVRADVVLPPERPHDPPATLAEPLPTTPPAFVTFGRFQSVQVNVNAAGANVVGDAANEPSIAVDPFDHLRMAIGWRQFDKVSSDFREAGFAWSANAGATWTAGTIQNGIFRSDPEVVVDAEGNFFYQSLDSQFHTELFASSDHGQTWGSPVAANGGDKPWMTIDRTSGPGRDHVYEEWSTSGDAYYPNTFSRSVDDGASFEAPDSVPDTPTLGTLDVGPDGTLYVVGNDTPGGPPVFSRSSNAADPLQTPSFTTTPLDLGGAISSGAMNPEGLLGQPWIAVDRSNGPHAGWIYVLCSVRAGLGPLDVHFIRSTDGGATWSAPVRVNDDPAGTRAFHWFGTMSVSPDGRIDAVWNDTRGQSDSTWSALYYSYSLDGGATWSVNEQASPAWKATVGFPKQKKIGDYDQMISDVDGADLAYAATFNNEEDVYYLRLAPPLAAVAGRPAPGLQLLPGAPNPFVSATTIRFVLAAPAARVALDVVDVSGRRVAMLVDSARGAGAHRATWNGTDVAGRAAPPGVYLCRLRANGVEVTRRLVRL